MVSTSECTASLSMAAEPVSAAAMNFAVATSRLPARAVQTALRVPFFPFIGRCRLLIGSIPNLVCSDRLPA